MVGSSPPVGPQGDGRAADGPEALLARVREDLRPEFDVSRHLGRESFGSLFLAREVALRRAVVVKVFSGEHMQAPDVRRRFEREMLAAARISHPNVVPIFRVGALDDGTPYYVQPYLGDCTLGERLDALRRFEPAQVRQVMRDIAGALVAAHKLGIVHRGIHPGAFRCEESSGRVLLTDFGLSGLMESVRSDDDRLTPSGAIFGSAGYMSPEQMLGRPATDRSDVYALGLVAWRLLTGAAPGFPSPQTKPEIQWQAWEESVGEPQLTELIHRCLALDPHALLIYAPSGWVVLQVVDQLVQQGLLERTAYLMTLATVLAGMPAALVVAWHHGARGTQRVTAAEKWLLGAIALAWMIAVAAVWRGA